jgi:hypothetical protein
LEIDMENARLLSMTLVAALAAPWATAGDADARTARAGAMLRDLFQSEPWRLAELRARLERLAEDHRPAAEPVMPANTVSGRWLIYKKLAPVEAGYFETYWNFTPLVGPLGLVQTDRTEFGFSIDAPLPPGLPAIAFVLKNDQLACAPVYVGFKPQQPATQITGLLFCTDGSGVTGDWTGCNNPVVEVTWPGMLGATCPALPLCPYTDPNCS